MLPIEFEERINGPVAVVPSLTFIYRFLYHFTGTRQTNRLDKPEWFYTQILAWAKESHLFVAQTFQSAALLAYQETLNVRVSYDFLFTTGMRFKK